jgi:predicted 3-demethylubiquinone-9 3-methyltransferase (glyoxalase superfamily)
MQKITTFLWFNNQAEEAANFYCGIFKNSSVDAITRYGAEAAKASGRSEGSVMTVAFRLDGQEFAALNGGPHFKFTEAISLVVNCETQAELDMVWEKLVVGGEPSQCGWLKDKYGLSWQIVPAGLPALLSSADPAKAGRVMTAIMQMKKLDIAALEKARDSN